MAKKILIVDDDSDIIFTIKNGIGNLTGKYEIMGVNSGEECISSLQKGFMPDLIILDIMMPNMNGWETYDYIKNNREWCDIPVVFLTALDDQKTMKRGMKTDAFCVRKPFEMKRLKEIIDSVLDPL